MKKLIAILCAVAVLATSLFGALVFTAAAEEAVTPVAQGDVLEDTAVLPTYLDENGNSVNIFHTNENIPTSVINNPTASVVKNTTGLPLTALFKLDAGLEANKQTELKVKPVAGKGALVYIEMPESADGNDVRFSTQVIIRDGQTGRLASRYQYGYKNWYFMGENESAWTSKTISYYGVPVPSGFKGYVYIPFNTIGGGATDLPDTLENEANPQKRNSTTGALIYTDNLTGSETESATDAEGNPNKAKIDYQPTTSNPFYANTGIDAEDEFAGLVIQTGAGYMANNGNMSITDKIVVSAPVVVKGEVTDGTLPDTRKVVAGGKEEYLFKSYVPYEGTATYTALRTPDGTKRAETWGDIVMTKIPAISPLVSGAYEFTNLSTQTRTFQSEASVKDSELIVGFMFYVETTLENFEVNMNSLIYDTSGSNKYPATSYNYGDLYYIKEGDTKWTATGSKDGSGASATYRRKLKTTGTFKGYIYQPISGSASTVSMTEGYFKYAGITLWPTTADGSWTDASGAAATLKISDPILVTALNTTTNMVVLDGGALVDPITGEGEKKAYLDADTFVGNVADIDLVGDVMSLTPLADPTRNAAHVVNYSKGTFSAYTGNGYTGTIVENDTIFGDDLVRVVGSETATTNNVDMLEMSYTQISTADVDGYMMYIRNESETTLRLAFQPYTVRDTGAYNYTQVSATLPFLTQVEGKWKWISKARVESAYEVAPGEGGYFYFSNATLFNGASYKYGKIRTADKDKTGTTNVNFIASAPIAVNNFTQNAAGMAYVNGATVPQDLYSGEFTVPNDHDGNLSVDVLDLVQAKTEATAEAQRAFKDIYLTHYFTEANYKKAVFKNLSLNSFTGEDSELFTNPERGYRTEMPIYIKAGAPDPLYYYPTYPKYESDNEWVNGVYFETAAEARAWVNTKAAAEGTVNLIYYQNSKTLVDTATVNSADTFVIDAKEYTEGPNAGKTLYYVYRAFETSEDAEAFCHGEFNLKGDNAHVSRGVEVGGKTYYTVRYDDRTVFTGMTEAEQKARIEYVYRIYFNRGSNLDRPAIALLYIYLSDWNGATAANPNGITEELPADALQSVRYLFDVYRGHSVKAEARFSYNGQVSRSWKQADVTGGSGTQIYNDDWLANNCANQNTILKHIDQLAPIITEYKDAIFNISCGFIGYVGEMAEGYQYPHVDYATVQKAIVEKLCVPNNLYFSTREPSYKEMIRESFPNWEYFDRVATNCDSFYGEQTKEGWNSGDFQKGNPANLSVDWWEYVTANAAYTPQGGEMYTIQSLVTNNRLVSGLEAILQLAHHRYTTFSNWHGYYDALSYSYNLMGAWKEQEITPEILDANGIAYDPAWFKDGVKRNAYDFIRDHLGYRLVAEKAIIDWGGTEESTIDVTLDLKNYGFAAAFNLESGIVILDKNGNVVEKIKVGTPSTWYNLAPDYYTVSRTSSAIDDVLTHRLNVSFASIMEDGKYRVGFYLKNNAGKYVHLANDLEFVNGYNIVGDFVVVDQSHNHYYAPATCAAPATCKCGETKGATTGVHTYYNKECSVCKTPIDVTGTLGNVMIMGDSISTFDGYSYKLGQFWYGDVATNNTDVRKVEQTWWNILISNMDANLVYNRSCSGSTIAEARWSDGVATKAYNSFNARFDQVVNDNELATFGYSLEDIDTFIFFGGTNDNNVANMGEAKYSDWTSEDLKYFAPAYCRYVATVKANCPNAKIVSLVDTTLKQVADTQIAINEHYGITTVTINGFDEVAPHPTVKGMRQIEETLRIALSE